MRSSCRRGGIIIAVVASKVDVSVVEHVSTMCKVSRANVEQWKHSPGTELRAVFGCFDLLIIRTSCRAYSG